MNLYTEQRFDLYENPEIQSLDPLFDLLRSNPFHDLFWDFAEDEEELPSCP